MITIGPNESFEERPTKLNMTANRAHSGQFTVVVERCAETGLLVGYVPGFPGAHSQGETLDELQQNMAEVIAMLLEDGEPEFESEFIGTQQVRVD